MRLLVPAAMLLASVAALTLSVGQAEAAPVAATSPVPFAASEARSVVATLADTLERDYMLPEAGKAYASALRAKLEAGGYDRFDSAKAFAGAVTADLQAVHTDAHLNLLPPRVGEGGERAAMSDYPTDSTILAKGWLAPGTAYVSFSAFFANQATGDELAAFLREARGAKTLLLDLRRHMGGEFAEMDMIFAQLFAARTALLDMDTREAVFLRHDGAKEEGPTIVRVAGPAGIVRQRHWAVPAQDAGLTKTRVYLLTSSRTASVAEHFALALKRTGRATLVGETTRGAGNYGDFATLGFGYSIFVPDGRTYDPGTGQGWEGTGVAPDVAVPAADALAEALRRAGVKVDAAAALAALSTPKVAAR
jgi:hypothetical protein